MQTVLPMILRKLTLLMLLLSAAAAQAKPRQPFTPREDSIRNVWLERHFKMADRHPVIYDSRHPKIKELWRVEAHPAFDSILTPGKEAELLAEIERRWDSLGQDSLSSCDMLWALRPYIDFLRYEDPHYRIFPKFVYTSREYKSSKEFNRDVVAPPFDYICINDTVIVQKSLDTLLRCGDMITAINGRPVSYYLRYSYGDRYNTAATLMHQAHYADFAKAYSVEFIRDGKPCTAELAGCRTRDLANLRRAHSTDNNIRTYAAAGCGYIAIPSFFPDNSRLIRIIRKAVLDFRKRGITDVILDLRRNTGGNGGRFDELMSIFIDKPVVQYCKGQRVKVSDKTLGWYDFLTGDMKGRMADIPGSEYAAEFATRPQMYVGGMRYYVMMSIDTGSVAASFCNIMQYNGAGMLAGEPLRHNALKYGEITDGRSFFPVQLQEGAVSTVEIDEYTLAEDGILRPDIALPCIAAQYLSGRDAMLENMLEIIAKN